MLVINKRLSASLLIYFTLMPTIFQITPSVYRFHAKADLVYGHITKDNIFKIKNTNKVELKSSRLNMIGNNGQISLHLIYIKLI